MSYDYVACERSPECLFGLGALGKVKFQRTVFHCQSTGARVQRNSSTMMRVWKQWTNEHRTTRKTGNGRRKMTSARDDRHFLRMVWTSLTKGHRQLRLQWAHEHRAWQSDWHQVAFKDESRFNVWDHGGRIRVRRCAGERCLPECVIERHSGLIPGVTVLGAISYHGRYNLLRIEGNLNSSRYVRESAPVCSRSLPIRHPWIYLSAG
ncbi:transposable element Tcb2 transposase [Trichonephila clavipes]|nr:transposable element Tcb2 transposase [Trichonephila clavipes]